MTKNEKLAERDELLEIEFLVKRAKKARVERQRRKEENLSKFGIFLKTRED